MKHHISLIGMPIRFGQRHPGVALGPDALRATGIVGQLQDLGHFVEDLGNIPTSLPSSKDLERERLQHLYHLYEVVHMNEILARKVDRANKQGHFPLILGGDHSLALGSIAGLAKHRQRLGVIWFDAHADMNTEQTSPSGNIHGMPLAANLGYGHEQLVKLYGYQQKLRPEHVVLIGLRDIDEGEKKLLHQLNIRSYDMLAIDRLGIDQVIQETVHYLTERTDHIHLSLDMDSLDPEEAPGVGTPVHGGLTYRESNLAMHLLSEANCITSCDLVEVNPLLDHKNQTAQKAVQLIKTLL